MLSLAIMKQGQLKRGACAGMLGILSLGLFMSFSVAANDWISLQRARPYQGLTPEQAQQRRRAQILHYLQQQDLKKSRSQVEKKPPVPDSRFPESYRALADYYRQQGQRETTTPEK